MQYKIAFYSPFGTLREWRLQEMYVAKACLRLNHDVDILECKGFQKYCFAMAALGVSGNSDQDKKIKICNSCNSYKDILFENNGAVRKNLADYLNTSDLLKAKEIAKAGKSLPINFIFKKIPIGKISRNHVCIKNQEIDAKNLPKTSELEYSQEIENCILIVTAAEKLLKEKKYDFVFLQNGMYPSTKCLADVAKKNGSTVIAVDNGLLKHKFYESVRFSDQDFYTELEKNLEKWRFYKKKKYIPIFPAIRSLKCQMEGKFIRTFSKPPGQKLDPKIPFIKASKTVLIILSSQDELIVAQLLNHGNKRTKFVHIFKDQVDWLKETLNIAEMHPEILFIFRPHPREWKNEHKPFGEISSNGQKIIKILKSKNNSNIYVDLPKNAHSVYDLIKKADLVLNGWSTVGEEAVCLGVNVATIFPKFCNYPAEQTLLADSKKSYYKIVVQKNNRREKKINQKKAFDMMRWITFNSYSSESPMPNFNNLLKRFDKSQNKLHKMLKKILPGKIYKSIFKHEYLFPKINKKIVDKLIKILNNKNSDRGKN